MAVTQIRGNTQILAGSITNTEINASAAIDFSKLAALTDGNVLIGNGSNVATSVDLTGTGDIEASSTNGLTYKAGSIDNADINASAAIDFSKLASLTDGNLLIGNASNVATSVDLTGIGDIEVSATGGLTYKAGSIVDADINASAAIALSKLAEAVIQADGGQAFTADQSMGNNKLTNVATPTADQDAANKVYVDGVAQGLDAKNSTTAGTDAALPSVTASGSGVGKTLTADANALLTVDGFSTWTDMDNDGAVNDPNSTNPASRVLVKNQAAAADNGIYAVKDKGSGSTPFILVRAVDFDGSPSNEVSGGAFTFIENGTANANTGWVVTNDGLVTVDTDTITFTQFSGAGAITAGAGLAKSGNVLSIGDLNRGIQINADDIEIDGSEVAAADGGLQENGTNSWQLEIKPDVTTGATVAPLTTGTNGAGVTVDNSTVTHSGGTLSVGTISTSNISDIVSASEASGQILVRDNSNDSYDNVTVGGDATLAFDGTLTLASNVLKEADFITREVPTGLINGSNTTYTLASTPVAGSEHVYLNGILQNAGGSNDYTISGDTITYNNAPQTGDVLLVSYIV